MILRRLLFLMMVGCVTALCCSCSSMRWGGPAKAGCEPEQEAGWAQRNIPGVQALSSVFPAPSDARKQWDQYQKRRNDHWTTDSTGGTQFP